jgi:hypothetical protein
LAVGLPLVGCVQAPTTPTATPAAQADLATGTHIPGVQPAQPTITVHRDEFDLNADDTVGNVLEHSSAFPILQVTHH